MKKEIEPRPIELPSIEAVVHLLKRLYGLAEDDLPEVDQRDGRRTC